ncbi:hypothetical protein FA15DRAFT_477628 [Coprinopsis marcescibilis]|uniref:MARVEL domain-containing protein n=1 Tax=Coprinopsis marcescibilis TaxID=230819 RepID=A0A5C3L7J8_COPMA|nr:hypothetical protein FA15DRAFT_477628 [Coprinopsis marcescibilis]
MAAYSTFPQPPNNHAPASPTTRSKRMPSLFNTIRASIYGSVLLFTVICLAMAGHFQTVLAASDLTRFVPFAIFVCSASLFIFMILVLFSALLRERNPISTRIELASLGLAGVFWLVLGVYLTTSESQDADVECFASAESQVVLEEEIASFHTDQFQAMYRVLTSFSLINAILVIASCLILLFLALRRHRNGDEHMWHGPVTSCAWFNTYNYGKNNGKPGHQTRPSMAALLPTAATTYTEKPQRRGTRESRRNDSTRQQSTEQSPRTAFRSNHPYGNYADAPLPSPPRQARYEGATRHDFEAGLMLNPYSTRTGRSGGRGPR